MIIGAGILFVTPDNRALFLKRGPGGDYPNFWCFPGGRLEEGETLEECAIREAKEELGSVPKLDLKLWTRRIKRRDEPSQAPQDSPLPGEAVLGEVVDFTTYLQHVDKEFAPELDGEHVGYAWAPISAPPDPMHPGCMVALRRFDMDELGIARAMAEGELVSPQVYKNVTLFAIRITGTGAAYRHKLDEFVWRDPSLYLNQKFVDRCSGLTVIMEHPEKNVLNSKEFKQRNIGSIMFAYIEGDEVWGIAKVYDDAAIAQMTEQPMSTSPAVVLTDPEGGKFKLNDGEVLLIEGKPSLLDHIAICERGVWDKGGEPTGVSLTKGDNLMSEEEKKAAEDRARADAEANKKAEDAKWDKLLGGLDGISKRLDTFEARLDSVEASKKDDDEEKEENKKEDDEEEEGAEKGKPKEVVADKSKKDNEEMKKEFISDKSKKDNEEMKKEDDDDDDDESKKADSADVKTRLARIEGMMKPLSDDEHRNRADAQIRADAVYNALGMHAPRPQDGEDSITYRRRIATALKVHSSQWKGVDLSKAFADSEAFAVAEHQIYADATEAGLHPKELPEFELRQVVRTDSDTGQRTISFYGKKTFISQLKPPVGNRVTDFLTATRNDARR